MFFHKGKQLFRIKRLGQEGIAANFEADELFCFPDTGRNGNNGQFWLELANRFDGLKAIHDGHDQIGQNNIGLGCLCEVDLLLPILSFDDVKA